MMQRASQLGIAVGLVLGAVATAAAYEPRTHAAIGARAVDVSNVDRILKDQFSLLTGVNRPLPSAGGQTLTLREWIRMGADSEDVPPRRAINHFHNPLRTWPQAGLNVVGVQPGQSSIYWQQNAAQGAGGTWSWPLARQRFHDFLTGLGQADRDAALADVARALGQMSHLIQDATSPPHTRNDPHLVHDGYEATMERFRLEVAPVFEQIVNRPQVGADPAIFTATGDNQAPAVLARLIDSDTYDGAAPAGNGTLIGNSEYTNGGYLSDDTIFQDFAFPRQAALGPPFFDPPQGEPGARRYFPKNLDGDTVSHFVAEGTLWERLQAAGQALPGGFILNERTYQAQAGFLVPRAVGYSASLYDRFFEREIEIAAPARYVYSRTTYEDGNTGSFTKMTFRVRKSTPGPAGSGTMTAVVRFRRGLADLIEEPLQISPVLSYAVSAPQQVNLGAAFTELTFDFGGNPIPTNSADLYLTVVYRGPAGPELQAVLFGDKDLFEPEPVDVGNITDYDCFGPDPYHVADFAVWPPFDFNNPDPQTNPQPRDLSVPKDGFPELFGPDEERNGVFMKVTSTAQPQVASPTFFDYQVPNRVAQPDPQFVRFFVLQDRPSFVLSWRVNLFVNRGYLPNGTTAPAFLSTVPEANVNRVFVDAGGQVIHEVLLPLTYRGLKSLDLNVLVVNIPRFNACYPNTIGLSPSLTRILGTPGAP
jgi:hypothetical protein